MDTEKQIKRLERQIAIKNIAQQYNVSERYVRYITSGERQPNRKKGMLIKKELLKLHLI